VTSAADHYREAETLLGIAATGAHVRPAAEILAMAQIRATLASVAFAAEELKRTRHFDHWPENAWGSECAEDFWPPRKGDIWRDSKGDMWAAAVEPRRGLPLLPHPHR